MKPKKVVYYTDPLNDEFSGTHITRIPLGKYEYAPTNVFFRLFSWFFYWAVAFPVLWLVAKIGYHVRVLGKQNRKMLKGQGVFFYGNHTQIIDAWTAQCFAAKGKRTYIVCNQDTTSIKGIRWLVKALGCIPTPENPAEAEQYKACIVKRIKQKRGIAIFPEAHIWPYSTHIRPFGDESFSFPAELGVPVVAMAVTYRRRKVFKNRPPFITIHLSKPCYPNMKLSLPERKRQLRDYVYEFLLDKAAEEENFEYIAYVRKREEAE